MRYTNGIPSSPPPWPWEATVTNDKEAMPKEPAILDTIWEAAKDLQNAADAFAESIYQYDLAKGDLQQSETEFAEAKARLSRLLNGE